MVSLQHEQPADAHTAILVAGVRALAARDPGAHRILDDPLSGRFAGEEGLAVAEAFLRAKPEALSIIALRHRFLDDWLAGQVEGGASQILLLGAGLDSRAYRLPALATVRVIEVDRPPVSAYKQALVRSILGDLPAHVRYLPLDAGAPSLSEAARAEIVPGKPLALIAEGLSCYLLEEELLALMEDIARLGDVTVAFDYFDDTYPTPTTYASNLIVQQRGDALKGFFDPGRLRRELSRRGFVVLQDVTVAELARDLMKRELPYHYAHVLVARAASMR